MHIDQEEAQEALEPFHDLITQALHAAVQSWAEAGEAQVAAQGRIRGGAITDLAIYHLRALYSGKPAGLTIPGKARKGSYWIEIRGLAIARLKALDKNNKPRNFPTARAKKVEDQEPVSDLAGLGVLPRLVIGYRLDEYASALCEVHIQFWKGRSLAWSYQLDTDTATPMPAAQSDLLKSHTAARKTRRVQIREHIKKDNNTSAVE